MLHLGRLWFDFNLKKPESDKHSSLFRPKHLRREKRLKLIPGVNVAKLFTDVIYEFS